MIREYSDRPRFCSIDDAVWKAGEPARMDIAFDLGIHMRATADSVEGIFQNVEETPIETRLSCPVKLAAWSASIRASRCHKPRIRHASSEVPP